MDELFDAVSWAVSWNAIAFLAVAGPASLLGGWLVLRMVPLAIAGREDIGLPRLLFAGVLLGLTGWIAFLVCLQGSFPHLDPYFPLASLIQGWLVQVAGAVTAVAIVARCTRNIRNVVLAGSLLSGGASCMLFIDMSGLTAPAPLAYDLRGVLAAMAASGMLCAIGFWQAGAARRVVAAAFIGVGLTVVASASLGSVLGFSDWSAQLATPGGMAFRPIVVVFISETVVTALLGLIGAAIDRRAATLIDHESERLREFTESTFEALVIHRDAIVLDANAVFCDLLGMPLSAVKGRRLGQFLADNLASPASSGVATHDYAIRTANGVDLPVEVLSRDISFAGGRAVVTALRDISERRAAEAKIRFLAHHDMLTGLPNRTQFHDLIVWHLTQSQRAGDPIAVLCVDLDRFKAVNDTFGHQAGDRLLQLVAERLLANVRTNDAAARIGGDEFIVLLTDVARRDTITHVARRLIEQLSEPFDLGGYEARIGASIGIAVAPQDGTIAEVLIKNADIALYRAKADGRGDFCFFQSAMGRQAEERRALEQELRQAVADAAFEVVFQPLFNLRTNEIVVLEALLRWPRPGLAPSSPAEFIPLAESTGLIVPLGRWVIEVACQAAVTWPQPCHVAVNVSARQFVGGTFAETVAEVLARTGLPADRLELEVTETGLMHDADQVRGILLSIKQMGAYIALDDFGTGYSSLSYLQRFPFDSVKIDRSFITTLADRDSDGARAIVGAILAMSHKLGLTVTAEGVETEAQMAMLRLYDCDLVQGFLLARPMRREQVPGYLAARQPGALVDRSPVAAPPVG
jgi:diguanylate cyclase (GGDEF)-like protein/PAS domain S-box-containing protein